MSDALCVHVAIGRNLAYNRTNRTMVSCACTPAVAPQTRSLSVALAGLSPRWGDAASVLLRFAPRTHTLTQSLTPLARRCGASTAKPAAAGDSGQWTVLRSSPHYASTPVERVVDTDYNYYSVQL